MIDNSAHCDCEKQVSDTTDMNQTEATQKIGFKEKIPDTVFTTLKTISYPTIAIHGNSRYALHKNSLLAAGFQSCIFQPPKV